MNKEGKILIVDDNEDILFALNLLLQPHVEKVKVTTRPERIVDFMESYRPDVILLDMNFHHDASSGQEGFHWLKQIHSIDPNMVVIFITAYGDTEKAVRAIKAGATDFIPKPWEGEKLLATISSALQLSKSRNEVSQLRKQVSALE
ncbi:MAG: response regulator, partial [Proteiniphilum sp.]